MRGVWPEAPWLFEHWWKEIENTAIFRLQSESHTPRESKAKQGQTRQKNTETGCRVERTKKGRTEQRVSLDDETGVFSVGHQATVEVKSRSDWRCVVGLVSVFGW